MAGRRWVKKATPGAAASPRPRCPRPACWRWPPGPGACPRWSARWPGPGPSRRRAPRAGACRGRSGRRRARSSAGSMPTPSSLTVKRAPSAVASTRTSTWPPVGVNLMALPMRLPSTWPRRGGSWGWTMASGGRCAVRLTPLRSAMGMACSTASSTTARRSSSRSCRATRPESSLDSSSRLAASQSSRSICWRLPRRNSSRVSGLLGRPLQEQLVEGAQRRDGRAQLVADVGHEVAAAVAVLADDGHRLLQALGHLVEGAGQLLHLRRRVGGDGHAGFQVALGQQPGGLGQAAKRARQPLGEQQGHDDGHHEGHQLRR